MALNKDKDHKLFYNIAEVAAMFDVNESLLRFWETKFPSIKPKKGARGIRRYTKEDIDEIRRVYHLVKERGLTLDGARQSLKHTKDLDATSDVLARLRSVRDELQAINREFNSIV